MLCRSRARDNTIFDCSIRRFWAVQILLVQTVVPIFRRSELPFDEQILHVGRQFQGVAIGDDKVGDFALFERAYLAPKAKNLRWIDGDGSQRFVVGQTMGNGVGRILSEAPRERVIEAGDGELYASGRQFGGLR